MRAIVLTAHGSTDNFIERHVPDPVPSDSDVLVRIRAASFNPIDYQIRRGGPESHLVVSPILGRDFAGVVERVGRRVRQWRPGDEVMA